MDANICPFLLSFLLQAYYRKLAREATVNTYMEQSARSEGIDYREILLVVFCVVIVVSVACSGVCLKAIKSSISKQKELTRRQKLQKNPDLFCEISYSECNNPDAKSGAHRWKPWNRAPEIETRRTAFLPYPNTGTCYQAPSVNPE